MIMAIVDLNTAIQRLKAGHIVAIPTETVYGLAARIDREQSLRQIFEAKKRPFFDPLIVHVSSVEQARGLTRNWPEVYDTLAEAFWPGPLTLIAPKSDLVSTLITSGLETVAVRYPNHPMALEILRGVGVPLAAPSANLFGQTSPTQAEHVESEFSGHIMVVDGGPCRVGVESTVLQAEKTDKPNHWRILLMRPGGISRAQIQTALTPKYKIEFVSAHSSPASPGHLPAHYQPRNPVVIVETSDFSTDKLLKDTSALLGKEFSRAYWLDLGGQPEQAARTLYDRFRRLSTDSGVIFIRRTQQNSGQDWEAIWDRVGRAASVTLKD